MHYSFSWSSIKFQGHRGQKSPILTQIGPFWNVTPVWIQWWLCNNAQNLEQHRRCALLFFQGHLSNLKVTQDKKSPILTQIEQFWTVTPVWIHQWIWNDAQCLTQYSRGVLLFSKIIHQISRSHELTNWWFQSNLGNITRPVAAIKSLRFALLDERLFL